MIVDKPERFDQHLPGEAGVWFFIVADMLMFALLFGIYAFYRGKSVEMFIASQASLNQVYGVINTLLLLTSSLFVVLAVRRTRAGFVKYTPSLFVLAGIFGTSFVALKMIEYSEKIAEGITLTSNDFYMYYFVLTGLHTIHVLIGLGVLIYLWHTSRRQQNLVRKLVIIESGASYWHMVDALWIVLFPLLYLMK